MGMRVPGETGQVFVLASGEYDDYRVHCVVEGGEEAAKTLAAKCNETKDLYHYYVEELPVLTPDVEPVVTILEIIGGVRISPSLSGLKLTAITTQERLIQRWPWDPEDRTGSMEVPAWWQVYGDVHGGSARVVARGTDHPRVRQLFEARHAELLNDELGGLRGMRFREGDYL